MTIISNDTHSLNNRRDAFEFSKAIKFINRWLVTYNRSRGTQELFAYDIWKRVILSHTLSKRMKPAALTSEEKNAKAIKSIFIRLIIRAFLTQQIRIPLYDYYNINFMKFLVRVVLDENKVINYQKFVDKLSIQLFNEIEDIVDRRRLNIRFFNKIPFCQECDHRLYPFKKLYGRPNDLRPCIFKTRSGLVHEFESIFKSRVNNRAIEIVDIDISIWDTVIEALDADDPEDFQSHEGYETHGLTFDEIKYRFIEIRNVRKRLIEASEKTGVNYTLYQMDSYEKLTPVAENRNHQFSLWTDDFNEYLKVSLDEIEAIGVTLITEELISQSIIPPEKKYILKKWIGYTVREALDKHIEFGQLLTRTILPSFLHDLTLGLLV